MSLFDVRFYDLIIHSPENAEEITRFAFEAKRYGYSGIAILNSKINYLNTVDRPEDFSIFSSIEIFAKPSKLRDEIRKHRASQNILLAKGGDEEFIREAVETEGLDILLQPPKFNNILARTAGNNSITLGFNLGKIIHMRGEPRIKELRIMRTNLKHARKFDLQMILTCDSHTLYDLRSPREMVALAGLFGMAAKEAVEAMSKVPVEIIRKKSPDYIQAGISIL
jgi:ribonuclease P/MRP protein subunit RPP1